MKFWIPCLFLLSSCASQKIEWSSDEQAVFETAARRNTPVFVDFQAKWCGLCFALEKRIFRDPRVVKKMQAYVPLVIDVSEESPQDFAKQKRYGVEGVPTMLLMNEKRQVLRYVYFDDVPSVEAFLKILEEGLASRESLTR